MQTEIRNNKLCVLVDKKNETENVILSIGW